MEPCYNRYVERLVVTNVSLFLFIMEFLLLVHICLICILSTVSLLGERQGPLYTFLGGPCFIIHSPFYDFK